MPRINTVRDLLADELKDLYSAEKQLTKAIPKMAKGASNPELKQALEKHLVETQGQVARLETIAEMMEVRPVGKKCKGMEGVIEEGSEMLEAEGGQDVLDLALIGAANRVEHYEISGYMSAIILAQQLGQQEVVRLLTESLSEEQHTEELLRQMAAQVLSQMDKQDAPGPAKTMSRRKIAKA